MVQELEPGTNKVVETPACIITYRTDGIVVMRIKQDVEIDLTKSRELFELLKQHVQQTGKKARVLVIPDSSATVTKEAREFAATDESSSITTAEAIIVKTIAQKLIINFTLKFYKPKRHMKMFTQEDEAIKWLSSFS
jgi:hypothetical protein